MNKIFFGLFVLVGSLLISSFATQDLPIPPMVEKLPSFQGDVVGKFIELRVQRIKFDEFGNLSLDGNHFISLINSDYIINVYSFSDIKKKQYSCILNIDNADRKYPLMVRQDYKSVVFLIKKAQR
jgi:hypothetical protein